MGQCFGCFIDLIQRKIVDFTVIRGKVKGRKRKDTDFDGPAQAMEPTVFERLIKRWMSRIQPIAASLTTRTRRYRVSCAR